MGFTKSNGIVKPEFWNYGTVPVFRFFVPFQFIGLQIVQFQLVDSNHFDSNQ